MDHLKYNRDISWLHFNARVLQEAGDARVPLYERIKFLAIWSSNLEEFYRIRVAEWKRLLLLSKRTKKELRVDPRDVLRDINKTVLKQQDQFNDLFWNKIVLELEAKNVFIVNEKQLDPLQKAFAINYFRESVLPLIKPVLIPANCKPPILDDNSIYMAIRLQNRVKVDNRNKIVYTYALVEIPSKKLSRFLILPEKGNKKFVLILGDLLRLNLPLLFPDAQKIESYSFKLSHDAELVLEDEFAGSLLKKIKRSLSIRDRGNPTRMQYDRSMPRDFLKHVREVFGVASYDLMPGSRYHNYSDLMNFPDFSNQSDHYPKLKQLIIPAFEKNSSLIAAIKQRDYLLHFPYHTFDYIIQLIEEAANDPLVENIKMTLYRVAKTSKVVKALLLALKNGKRVTVFVELKARFDEESNISHAQELEDAGAKVLYSFPILKVHSKMMLIERREDEKLRRYVLLSTGNFNESTSKLYCDTALLTFNKYIAREVSAVFDILADTRIKREFKQLLVAPDHMRHDLYTLIDQEIKNALRGKNAYIILKMNSLQDPDIIDKLYEASNDGVKIQIIVRGICCLVPGVKGLSENIKVISIVDRFLEHARAYVFCNADDPKVYLSSADFMERNLSRRFEVAFPIINVDLKQEIIDLLKLQWMDNTKARVINRSQSNPYRKSQSKTKIRSQMDIYDYLREKQLLINKAIARRKELTVD